MVGFVKLTQVLTHWSLPSNLHLQSVNPQLELHGFRVAMSSQLTALQHEKVVCGGVSSFGYSGTNSHAILMGGTATAAASVHTQGSVQYRHASFVWWEDSSGLELTIGVVKLHGITQVYSSVWEQVWNMQMQRYMSQHRVGHTPVMPGAVYIQMAHGVYNESHQESDIKITDARYLMPLFLREENSSLILRTCETATNLYSVESSIGGSVWTHHASQIVSAMSHQAATLLDVQHLASCAEPMDGLCVYAFIGNDCRGDFRCMSKVWLHETSTSIDVGTMGRLSFDFDQVRKSCASAY